MLEGLDDVAWEQYGNMYERSSERVPILIRDLTSSKKDVREEALRQLHELLNHQESIPEVTQFAVPFLIELLTYEEVEDRVQILFELHHIALSYFYNRDWKTYYNPRYVWGLVNAYKAVSNGRDVYLGFLHHDDPEMRLTAMDTIRQVGYFATPQTVDALKNVIENEQDIIVKAHAVLCFCDVIHDSQESRSNSEYMIYTKLDEYRNLIYEIANDFIEDRMIRLRAIIGLLRSLNFMPADVKVLGNYAELLLDFVVNRSNYYRSGKEKYKNIGVALDLYLEWFFDNREALETLLKRYYLRYSKDELGFTEALFEMIFDGKNVNRGKKLTEPQNVMLSIFADLDVVWDSQKFKDTLQDYHFPENRQEFLDLLKGQNNKGIN